MRHEWEASGKLGASSFSPEGRTYSPPRRHKLHILRLAASGRSHPFRCASFSHKVNDFVGALLRQWYACGIVRSPRGIAAVATASRQCHNTCGCCCHRLRRSQLFLLWKQSAPCPHKPATGSFVCGYAPKLIFGAFSLLRKRNRKRKNEVKKIWRFIIWKRRWSAGAQAAPQ